jgi:hypothetical protein
MTGVTRPTARWMSALDRTALAAHATGSQMTASKLRPRSTLERRHAAVIQYRGGSSSRILYHHPDDQD